jgi:hypothetical protein
MINIVNNWIDEDILTSIKQKYENARSTPSFEINNMGRWGKGLEAGSYAPVFILPLDEYAPYFIEKYQALDPIFKNFNTLTVFLHIWPPGSQITWHHDAIETAPRLSSTIYINEFWNWNWGGLFLHDDPDNRQSWIFPEHNKMIWFVPPIWHATSMIGLNAEYPRLSIQLFFNP